ncbi:glycosyltransferase family 2 protein [Paenibacillus sp. SI8]|uniref:glycosyltransferase family 2 protein n=1 Tax=unclassified Paenibacillus TaxID=185978 RepID=UPI0034667423
MKNKRLNGKQIFIVISIIATMTYLIWRTLFTLPPFGLALLFGIIFLVAEMIQALQSFIFYILLWKPTQHRPPRLPEIIPTVDILIATYNEPMDILQKTILACKNLEYPTDKLQIWLCDDKRRPEAEKLAKQFKINYLKRSNNDHAKAGNLNNALQFITGELVVTLDADMLPKPEFLQKTVGFFNEENVAFVQTPQSFYNEDIFQYNLFQQRHIPNEQDLFMQIIQSGRDRFNSAIYVGSNTIFRKSALDSIGGFATDTITEDMATGMMIQAKGYKTIAYSEVLAQGLASESLNDQLKQRIRWARGTLQTTRRWNPLTYKGLTRMQRILYINNTVYWYFGFFRLLYLCLPLLYLFFEIPVMNSDLIQISIFWLPYFLLSTIGLPIITKKRLNIFWSNVHETAMAPTLFGAMFIETFFKIQIPFNVTPKGVLTAKSVVNWKFMLPHLILIVLILAATAVSVPKLLNAGWMDSQKTLISLFWAMYGLLSLVPSLLLGIERPRMRVTERFYRDYQISVQNEKNEPNVNGSIVDISETGCRFLIEQLETLPEEIQFTIYGEDAHHLTGTIIYYDSHPKGYQVGVKFTDVSDDQMQKLIKELYGQPVTNGQFTYHAKNTIVDLIVKYTRNFQYQYRSRRRNSPRVEMSYLAQVQLLPKETYKDIIEKTLKRKLPTRYFLQMKHLNWAKLIDIGMYGCSFQIRKNITAAIGDGVAICLQEINEVMLGEIVRIEYTKKNRAIIGIKFEKDLVNYRAIQFILKEEVTDLSKPASVEYSSSS